MNSDSIKETISQRTLWFVVSWTIISLASGWIWTIYDKLSLALSNLDISAYYAFSFSFSLGFLFCFLLSLKLLNIQFPKGFFRFVFNKRTIWTIAVIGVLAIWISIECFAFPFFSNQAREEIRQIQEPYRIFHPEIFKMIIQRSWQAIPLIFLVVLECMVFAPILEELFFRRILLETLATRIGWFFGFMLSGLAFVAWHNEFVHLFMGNGESSWETLWYNMSRFLSHTIATFLIRWSGSVYSAIAFHSFANYVHVASGVSYSFFINWN